jgi:chromosome segregation ATPase
MTTRLHLLYLLALLLTLLLFGGVSMTSAERFRVVDEHLRQARADVEVANQQMRQQVDGLREKHDQHQQALLRSADAAASAEAQITAEQLRVLSGLLQAALTEAEAARGRVSKLLAEAERAKERLDAALMGAEAAKKEAEETWDLVRKHRELLEKETGDSNEDLQ